MWWAVLAGVCADESLIHTDSNRLFLFDSLEGMLFRAEVAYAAGGCD